MQEMEGRSEFLPDPSLSRPAPSVRSGPAPLDPRRRATLAHIVETELIPRLMLAHRAAPARAFSVASPVRAADPDGLVRMLLQGRREDARAVVEARLQSGATEDAVMIEDLGPAARRLGALWEADECDFVEVTVALGALRDLLRAMTPEDLWSGARERPSILILLAPGETHELGADMVESFFRSAGWVAERASETGFAATLSESWFDAVGFSVSCERFVEPLRRAIARARAISRNRGLKILVGGAIFAERPQLAGDLGADFCAADANAAVHLARTLLQPTAL